MILRSLLVGRESGFYVDVGAYHPFRFSNTQYFYERGWHGLNIDPTPGSMAPFNKYRTRDINLEIGIAETPGLAVFFEFDEPALNTFDQSRAEALQNETPYRLLNERQVTLQTLRDVLSGQAVSRIDFMSIDVETRELQVLESNDWSLYRPEFLLIEMLSDGAIQANADPVAAFLHQIDYRRVAFTGRTSVFRDTTTG